MCGIAGVINRRPDAAVDSHLLAEITGTLVHRGPDAEGFFLDAHIGVGHRRLKIIDLTGGIQPLFNEDGSVVVVYNGEIYNYVELMEELKRRGHIFRTHCDTEVIVHAYEEYGLDCPEKLRGMFAFALCDLKKGLVFAARDRVGIKPFYYHVDAERLLFGSEIKAILKGLKGRPGVKSELIDFYMSVGYVPGDETLFAGIRKLLPAHTLVYQDGTVRVQRYWDLRGSPVQSISLQEAQLQFEEIFTDCVRMRLMSEVPLGAFLSGGIDSSAVVAVMSRLMKEPVKTFSVGYEDDAASSELSYARVVAERFGTDHHEFILRSGDFFESLDLLLEHAEEPIVESAAVALYRLSKLAREHVTVILSGEGGDEVLAGYPLHQIMPMVDRIRRLAWLAPSFVGDFLHSEKALKYWDWTHLPLADRYWGISNDVTDSIKRRMYTPEFHARAGGTAQRYFRRLFDTLAGSSDLRRMTYVDIKSWLPEDLLLKADKMTMACSLELRVPFLDYRLMEFCLSLPDHYRLNGRDGKHLLKKVMERYLPSEIVHRKKQGFPVPIAAWLRGDLHERARETLLDPTSLARGYFRREYVEGVLKKHRDGSEDLSRRIFALLVLEMWHRRYVDG